MNDSETLIVLALIVAVGSFIGAWLIRSPAPPKSRSPLEGTKRSKRYFAWVLDDLAALLMFAIGGMALARLSESYWQSIPRWIIGCAGFLIYLGYYLVLEGMFATTPGKAFMGLRILQLNGEHCTWKSAWIRTLTRLIEVNPLLLGALPAVIVVYFSHRHQRIGDIWAGTVVTSRHAGRIPEARGDSLWEPG